MSPTTLIRPPLAAIAFLTRIPVGRLVAIDATDISRGAWLFPLVGGAVGAAVGFVAQALVSELPDLVVGALAVGLAALVTGAMHLDALADTADALGGTSRDRALEIMRDHAVGAYGAIALCLVCVVDASAIGALASRDEAVFACLAAGAVGRAAILPLARALPYARAGIGQGRALERMGWVRVVAGIALAVGLTLPGGRPGLAALCAAVLVSCVLLLCFRAWLGGVTGDALGATAKLCETSALVVFLVAL